MHCKPRKREERQKIKWKTSNADNDHCAFLPKALMVLAAFGYLLEVFFSQAVSWEGCRL